MKGQITGIDLFPDFIEIFNENAVKANCADRVKGITGSMDNLPFQNEELELIYAMTSRINEILRNLFAKMNIKLVDFKIEFGRTSDGEIVLADEVSPDTCRLWDMTTNEKLDKDRFRRDLGKVREAYEEILARLKKITA